MKTILVTGAAGYIGRHVVKKALDMGYRVIDLIQLFSEISEKLSEKSRIILNFINVKLIHDLCQRFKHLACLIKLRHIHAVEDHIRCLGNLLCCFRTKRYNGIHIVNFDRADNIVHFF